MPTTRTNRVVLLGADQRAGRWPTHCVKSGRSTTSATKVVAVDLHLSDRLQVGLGSGLVRVIGMLLRRRTLRVVLPVSPSAWRRWSRRSTCMWVLCTVAAGLMAGGIVRGSNGVITFGVVVLVVGQAGRCWATWRDWVGVQFRGERDQVVVARASSEFDGDARRLFAASLQRRSPA